MRQFHSIVDLIGNTPLVALRNLAPRSGATVLAKLEYLNPGGSVKDRIALRMILAAEADGSLRPGGTIIEPTSGNTGVGLVLVAQQRGYSCIFVCPDKVSKDKLNVLRAYGAEVIVCPSDVPRDHPQSNHSVSDRLVAQIDGAWKPNQYSNPSGPGSHEATTGPEIWSDTDGLVTAFVAGIGTGGTITGTGRYLKAASLLRDTGQVRVVGAAPVGSVYVSAPASPFLVEGVGQEFVPDVYEPTVVDETVAVSDADAFAMARRLAKEEGILVGGSGGLAIVAALQVAETLVPGDIVVALLPDGGRGYLSKFFDDDWMAKNMSAAQGERELLCR